MTERLFVTVLAGALGLLALVAAIHNHDVYYQLPKMRLIESSWGRRGARVFYAVLGVLILLLAAFIALDGRRWLF